MTNKLFASVVRRLSQHDKKKRTRCVPDGDKSVSTTANTIAASQSTDSAAASTCAQSLQEDQQDGGDSSFCLVQSSLPYSPQGPMIRANYQYDLAMCEDDDETYVSGMDVSDYADDHNSDCSSLQSHQSQDDRNKLQSPSTVATASTAATSQTSRSCVRLVDNTTPPTSKPQGRSIQMYRIDMDGSIKAIL